MGEGVAKVPVLGFVVDMIPGILRWWHEHTWPQRLWNIPPCLVLLLAAGISGAEFKVLLYIARRTYGFGRKRTGSV